MLKSRKVEIKKHQLNLTINITFIAYVKYVSV